ncbi:MAG: selenium-binding protein SBP56-related protein [Bacillota bacterium]
MTMIPRLLGTDPTFYASPRSAMEAPKEKLAYVSLLQPDAIAVVNVDPESDQYGKVVGRLDLPHGGEDELHHFGWNACSAALCPGAAHPQLERRYLVIPGLRSSRIYIADTKPDPTQPRLVKVLEPEEVKRRTGLSRPHTVHCGPSGIYVSAIGNAEDDGGPGGIMLLDHYTFEPIGQWAVDTGTQKLNYDMWWHLAHDIIVTSEWATPEMAENGLVPEKLLGRQYGHKLHFYDAKTRRHIQEVDLGDNHQMVLELRPAHDPRKLYGFVNVVTDVTNLASSIWVWYQENGKFAAKKVIEIHAEPAAAELLPPAIQPFGAVPPLVTDINLSLDDRFLYVSCWGTGELQQYDVSNPFEPKLVSSVHLGGIVRKAAHPSGKELTGGPQMIEISRDGRRLYVTNSLYSTWDDQFYPEGIKGWAVQIDVNPEGGMSVNPNFLVDFGTQRTHQIRLEGGDTSSDSFCFA